MVDFGKSDKMIKITRKVDKPTLTMASMILRSLGSSEEAIFLKKNEMSLNLLPVLVYPLFHLFLSYPYMHMCVYLCVKI